jgi:hypothetical protein
MGFSLQAQQHYKLQCSFLYNCPFLLVLYSYSYNCNKYINIINDFDLCNRLSGYSILRIRPKRYELQSEFASCAASCGNQGSNSRTLLADWSITLSRRFAWTRVAIAGRLVHGLVPRRVDQTKPRHTGISYDTL